MLDNEKGAYMDSSGAPYTPFSAGPDTCWGHFFGGAEVDCVRGHVAVHVSAVADGLGESDKGKLVAVAVAAFAGV